MAKIFVRRMATIGHPRKQHDGRISIFWMLPILIVIGFITFVFLYNWQNAQKATVPSVHVSTSGAPWSIGGQNGQ